MQNSLNSPNIDSYLAKTQLKFEELKEVIKISIICTEYGSKIVIVPLLVKAVLRNTDFVRELHFFQILSKEDSWSKKSTSEEQNIWSYKPSIFLWSINGCVLFLCATLFKTLVRKATVALWRKTLQSTAQWKYIYFFSRGRGSHVLVAHARVKTLANEDKI